jgi:uncharacterized delta-60 repeat protein
MSRGHLVEKLPTRLLLAAAGDLDPTFGTGGRATFDLSHSYDQASALVLQPDGRLIAAGNGTFRQALRLTIGGAMDASFAAPANLGELSSAVRQADGKLVVTPTSAITRGWFAARLTADGSLDAAFGQNGFARVPTTGLSSNLQISASALMSDGRIVVAGRGGTSPGDAFVARLRADGTLDPSFASGVGYRWVDFGSPEIDVLGDMAVQSDGKIVLAGHGYFIGTGNNIVLARLNPDGALDSTFGAGGLARPAPATSPGETAEALAIDPDGSLWVAGSLKVGTNESFLVMRFTSTGAVDSAFGTGGRASIDFGGDIEDPSAILPVPGGVVVTGAARLNVGGWNFAAAALTSGGALEPAFGTGGKVINHWGGDYEIGRSAIIDGQGRLLVGGSSGNNFAADLAVARYLGLPQWDVAAPFAVAESFQFATGHTVAIQFSEDVSASLAATDVSVQLLPGGASFSPSAVSYDTATNTAKFSLPTSLADGNYRATLAASNATDPAGHTLAAAATVEFFVLGADANHDRVVDTLDFNALAGNFGGTGKTFPQGDFNYDGVADTLDFNTLASRFGRTMPPIEPTFLLASAAPALNARIESLNQRIIGPLDTQAAALFNDSLIQ